MRTEVCTADLPVTDLNAAHLFYLTVLFQLSIFFFKKVTNLRSDRVSDVMSSARRVVRAAFEDSEDINCFPKITYIFLYLRDMVFSLYSALGIL